MITVTPQAAEQILKSAGEHPDLAEACLRLAARLDEHGGIEYGMGFDARGEGDVLFESNRVKVVVSAGCVELLTGATLDYVEINAGEPRFIFINPNDPSHKSPGPGRAKPSGDGTAPGS
ncbi:MAG TPA: iron-sulfur cluster assembly accessory protein [Usitatibacter sp.]|nr:iron-sulfur cluster assembly accessory protein [Usitatibacter sp.]